MKLDDYHIIMPGRIIEYFPEDQTATVKISSDRIFSNYTEDESQVTPGVLKDVPVFTAGGGGWHTTYPIKPGNTCLINFSQFGYDHWFVNDEDRAGVRADGHPQPWTRRKFSLDDGFAQVGWNNLPNAIQDYNATDAEFRNADREQRVSLLEDGNLLIKTGTTTINLAPSGDITVNTDTAINVVCDTATVTAATSTTIDTPETTITGNVLIEGTLTVVGDIIGQAAATITGAVTAASAAISGAISGASASIGGKDFGSHTHNENGDGGGTTGPPN